MILILTAIKLTAQTEKECDQFIAIIEFLKNDSTANEYFKVKNIRFEINPQIAENKGTPFLITEYYADKMNLTENEIKSDTTILNSIHRDNQNELLQTDTIYRLSCIENLSSKRPNVYLGFSRLDTLTLAVGTSKILKRKRKHTYGRYYIFLFDSDNSIRKILKTEWIE
jgi:hypothetical protein